MRFINAVLASALFLAPPVFCQEHHQHALTDQEVGSVHFSTSCRADLAENFNRAVALLHSFQYEQSRQSFTEISQQDPQCAMAQWGVAMSYYHGMWGNGDTAAGAIAFGLWGASNADVVLWAAVRTSAGVKLGALSGSPRPF